MNRKLIGSLLLFLATCGCCACDCNCDYLPPVLDGPYSSQGMRSGSAMAGDYRSGDHIASDPIEGETITPLPAAE